MPAGVSRPGNLNPIVDFEMRTELIFLAVPKRPVLKLALR